MGRRSSTGPRPSCAASTRPPTGRCSPSTPSTSSPTSPARSSSPSGQLPAAPTGPGGSTDRTRRQLRLVGAGILATALIGVTANIALPYGYADFRFIHVGTLSTILLLIAVAYAVFVHHLFSVRVIVRKALVYAALISVALEAYQVAVGFLADLLPFSDAGERHFAATAVALVVHASTQAALRTWLEEIVGNAAGHDVLGKRGQPGNGGQRNQLRTAAVSNAVKR